MQQGLEAQRDAGAVPLLVSRDGLPRCCDVHSGDIWEGRSLVPLIQKTLRLLQIEKMVCMADRGMFGRDNHTSLDLSVNLDDWRDRAGLPHGKNLAENSQIVISLNGNTSERTITFWTEGSVSSFGSEPDGGVSV